MPPRVPAALADEWPTLLGLGLGVIALWLSIPTRIELPGGSDWGEYIRSADYIWRHTPGAHYTDWRRPLYPYLLGLGALAVGTYARAAVLLATASLYSMVLSAGLAARSLAGPWATLPAAVGVAAVPALLPTVRWANLYPLEGALFGAAFAFGAATLRRGSPPLALLAGTCAGLCTLVDARGALAIPVAAVLVLGGIRRPGQGIALVVLFVLPIVALHLGEARVVEAWHLKQMTILEQLHGQHDLTTTKAGAMAFDNDVTRQCKITTGKPTDLPPLFGVCPDAVRNSNLRGHLTFATRGPDTRTTQFFINFVDNANLDSMGFAAFAKVVDGMNVVDGLYKGYGEGFPNGSGPKQDRIQNEGNAYLKAEFPQLDYIQSAELLP